MSSISVPPGPLGTGRHGSRRAFDRDRLGFLLHQREYGDLVRFDDELYVVNSPGLAEEVRKHTNSTYTITRDLLGEEADGGRASEDLARWMRARSLAGRGLNRSGLRAAGDGLAATAARHAESWRARGRIEAIPALEEPSARLIAEFCLGPEVGQVPALVARLQDARLPGTVPLPLPARWPSPRRRRLHRVGRELTSEVSRLLDLRRRRQEDSPESSRTSSTPRATRTRSRARRRSASSSPTCSPPTRPPPPRWPGSSSSSTRTRRCVGGCWPRSTGSWRAGCRPRPTCPAWSSPRRS